jgi:hypothetical protein
MICSYLPTIRMAVGVNPSPSCILTRKQISRKIEAR